MYYSWMQKFKMSSEKHIHDHMTSYCPRWRWQLESTTGATGWPTRAVSLSSYTVCHTCLISKYHQVHHLHHDLQAVGFLPRGLSTTPTIKVPISTMTSLFLRSLVPSTNLLTQTLIKTPHTDCNNPKKTPFKPEIFLIHHLRHHQHNLSTRNERWK